MCGWGQAHTLHFTQVLAEADVAGTHTLSTTGPKLDVSTHRPQHPLRKTPLHNNSFNTLGCLSTYQAHGEVEGRGKSHFHSLDF